MTPGSGLPGEWWTPPADAAMRDGNPKGGALRPRDGRKAVSGTRGRSQAVELWRRRKARGRMKLYAQACGGW